MEAEPLTNGTRDPDRLPSADSVCAVLVTYHPDPAFPGRLATVMGQVGATVIVDNTPGGFRDDLVSAEERLHLVRNRANLGVACALNQGIRFAAERGFTWALLLDQDTECGPDMVDGLIGVLCGVPWDTAMVGANYWDVRRGRYFLRWKDGAAEGHVERRTVITSGTLLSVQAAHRIGQFCEEFFIDSVDHEFCLRARARGYRVVATRRPLMKHTVGNPTRYPKALATFGAFDHPPARKYYIARNCLVTILRYFGQEPAWCLRQLLRLVLELASIVLVEDRKGMKMRCFLVGLRHGFSGRLGPIESAWPDGSARIEG